MLGFGLAAGGCGGPPLARAPTPPTDLGGHWVLDPAASDDAAAAIAAVIPKPTREATRTPPPDPAATPGSGSGRGDGSGRNRRGGGRGTNTGSAGSSNRDAQAAESAPVSRRDVGELLRAFAQPAVRLDIDSAPGRVTIASGGRPRSFEPGAEDPIAITDRYGSRSVRAGWSGGAFRVVSVAPRRLEVTEQYHAGGGDTLDSQVEVSAAGLKKLKVHAVYRRATAAEIASPASEGPPAPR